nr:protein NYNRIN-like [Coffea arabica]
MERDCIDFVRRYIKCQVHGDVIRAPPTELHTMIAPWPCSMWGMDVIGTIDPPISNGHRFILVAIEYFTKWVEAESFKHVTKKVVASFLRDHIICRLGVPETLITDNAKNLNNDMVDGLCEQFKIRHRNFAIYRLQMSGAVEAANKNLKKIIRKMTEKHRDWHEKLPYALMAYRTSIRTSTGATPYSLMYGIEAVLPAEVEISSLCILMETKLEEADWLKQRYEQMSLIDEKRLMLFVMANVTKNAWPRPTTRKSIGVHLRKATKYLNEFCQCRMRPKANLLQIGKGHSLFKRCYLAAEHSFW